MPPSALHALYGAATDGGAADPPAMRLRSVPRRVAEHEQPAAILVADPHVAARVGGHALHLGRARPREALFSGSLAIALSLPVAWPRCRGLLGVVLELRVRRDRDAVRRDHGDGGGRLARRVPVECGRSVAAAEAAGTRTWQCDRRRRPRRFPSSKRCSSAVRKKNDERCDRNDSKDH